MSGIPPNSLFSVFAFAGFLLAGLPLPWHIRSWNTGTCMYMLWTSLGCLILFVNSVVWNNNVTNSAPVWCDISARYIIGASVGIPASSLCIIRRLYYMTKLQTVSIGKEKRRREIMVDALIGIGSPCIVMTLQYVVQGRRFLIIERIGCYPCVVNTPAAYFLIYMWPLVFGLFSLVYAVLTFRRAFSQRENLKKMRRAGFCINARHYWRLMAVCSTEIAFTVPLSLYVIITNALDGPVDPYGSWAQVHSDFSEIPQYPTVLWQSMPNTAIPLEIWRSMYILCAFIIFASFGWVQDARDFYCEAFWSVCRRLGYSKPSSSSLLTTVSEQQRRFTYAGEPTFPIHDVDQKMKSKHLSMPVQARVKHYSLRTSLSFDAPPRWDSSPSPGLRPSVDEGSIENLPSRPSVRGVVLHTHISWAGIPAAPEPALARGRLSCASDRDVDRQV